MRKHAFTLSEVLITLAIIGVVAAMTIPTLISKYQEKTYITKLEQSYSIFSQAFKLAEIENGAIANWSKEDDSIRDRALVFFNNLKPHLKLIKECTEQTKECFSKPVHYTFDEAGTNKTSSNFSNLGSYYIIGTLSNGTDFIIDGHSFDKSEERPYKTYAVLMVDLNGAENAPNMGGVDMFYFFISDNGPIPRGTPDTAEGQNFKAMCIDLHVACTHWVLTYKNMDYRKCDDLNLNGKTSCKD